MCRSLEQFCSLLFGLVLWFAMRQDSGRSCFVSGPRMYPLHPLNPLINTDTDADSNCAFFQLTSMGHTLGAFITTGSRVRCVLKYRHWPMKQTLFLDHEGCQWRTVPI